VYVKEKETDRLQRRMRTTGKTRMKANLQTVKVILDSGEVKMCGSFRALKSGLVRSPAPQIVLA
jgi:hypothetical protein